MKRRPRLGGHAQRVPAPPHRRWPVRPLVSLAGALLLATGTVGGAEATQRELTVMVVGDVGVKDANKATADKLTELHKDPGFDALVYLGDNFYPIGLNEHNWEEKRDAVLGPFVALHRALGRDRVHALAGNHDYYQATIFHRKLAVGCSTVGNNRAQKTIDHWTYHYFWPQEVLLPLSGSSTGAVQFVFFDSARALCAGVRHSGRFFDALTEILRGRRDDPDVVWRVLALHHPPYSVGDHGNQGRPCGKRSFWRKLRPGGQDNCASEYARYVAALEQAVHRSGVKVQLVLAGHDHSLQLLDRRDQANDCPECPDVHVVSGSAAKGSSVAPSSLPAVFTPVQGTTARKSPRGFAELRFGRDHVRVRFLGSDTGAPLLMGDRCEFWVGRNGALQLQEPGGCASGDISGRDPE